MVFATDRKSPRRTLGVINPRKGDILTFMRGVEPYACAEGYVTDYATGNSVRPLPDDDYVIGDLCWSASDRWNFEHNDLELDREFCRQVLELV